MHGATASTTRREPVDADTSYIKITHHGGMINIDSDRLRFCDIKDMYLEGDGTGMQYEESIEGNRDEIYQLCNDISSLLYRLADIV